LGLLPNSRREADRIARRDAIFYSKFLEHDEIFQSLFGEHSPRSDLHFAILCLDVVTVDR
jgi:hypothetical protein